MAKTHVISCVECKTPFKAEVWNKKRKFCSKLCLNRNNASKKRFDNSFFIKCKDKYGDTFSYEKSDLTNRNNNKIIVTCRMHGDFWILPGSHLRSKSGGCRKCINKNQTKSKDQFIKEASNVHGDKYNYKKVKYINNASDVEIICKEHGPFWQLPYQHTNLGSGCPECIKVIRISEKEKRWLDSCNVPSDDKHRQVLLTIDNKKYYVDGLVDNTIYEFLGDYWHGNPLIYDADVYNKSTKKHLVSFIANG